MKVSVVMPILNRADFHPNIQRTKDYQTYPVHEWIMVEELESFAKHDDPLIARYILHPDRKTYTEKKVYGCRHATGDLIVIMSSDDYYSPDYIRLWVEFMQTHDSPIARFRGHWVYNIVDRRYGYVRDVSGGHSVYMREWALDNYDHNENTLNKIDMPRTSNLDGEFAIIRHTPAGDMDKATGFRPTQKYRGRGHTCSKEQTPHDDPDGLWLFNYIRRPEQANFYLNLGDKYRGEYPCVS